MKLRNLRKGAVPEAQAAMEYLLLLGAVVVIVLLAFNTLIPQHQRQAEGYFNVVTRGILGEPVIYWNGTNTIDRARADVSNYP